MPLKVFGWYLMPLLRYGAWCEQVIMMPSYVNIEAMWMKVLWLIPGPPWEVAHRSAKERTPERWWWELGGVLEPVQASPVIIEDNCFIGSRCIVEGAHIEKKPCWALRGHHQSTRIIDVVVQNR